MVWYTQILWCSLLDPDLIESEVRIHTLEYSHRSRVVVDPPGSAESSGDDGR